MIAAPCLAQDNRALGEEGLPGILSVSCRWKVLHHKAVNSPLLSSDMPSPWHFPWMSAFHGIYDGYATNLWPPQKTCLFGLAFYYPTIITGLNLYCLGFLFLLHLPFYGTFQHPFSLSTYHLAVVTIAFRSAKPDPVCFIGQLLLSRLLFAYGRIDCLFSWTISCQIAAIEYVQWGGKYESM